MEAMTTKNQINENMMERLRWNAYRLFYRWNKKHYDKRINLKRKANARSIEQYIAICRDPNNTHKIDLMGRKCNCKKNICDCGIFYCKYSKCYACV